MATLNMRLDDAAKATLVEAAALRGVNLTEYIRTVVLPQARREVEAAGHQVLALTADEQLELWRALQEPVVLTPAQRKLGRLMRGEE